MTESRNLSSFGLASLLITHQATLRDALVSTIDSRYPFNESLAMQLEEAGGMAILRQEVISTKPPRRAAEMALGVLFRMCSDLLGAQWWPSSVNSTHSAPSDRACIAACSRVNAAPSSHCRRAPQAYGRRAC
jgi:Arabinose-binding domain of AraC transcription regulator, N-term